MEQWLGFPFFSLFGYLLFIISEVLALSRLKSNGVLEFVSRKVLWLGGKRIRVQVGIQSGSSSESGEEETLINENVD